MLAQHQLGIAPAHCARIRWPNDVLMLVRRLRRRPNIKTAMGERVVCAEYPT